MAVNPLAQRITNAVYQNSPRVYCFTCLAAQQGLNEHDVRAAALVLVTRAGLRLVRRVCFACRQRDEVLAGQKGLALGTPPAPPPPLSASPPA